MKQRGFFDENDRLQELSLLGDPLEKLNGVIDWESFRHNLNKVFKKEAKGPGGRPPYDYVIMFKILILQRLYGIGDGQAEYQIKDRLSFMRFLGFSLCDTIPDEKTIWLFRERLVQAKAIDTLFYRFTKKLEDKGLITREGSIVDASFVDVPRQRNSKEENDKIKNGEVPEDWKAEGKENMVEQKDVNARWTRKNDEKHFGYKNHVKADKDSKLIVKYEVTSAEVHDSQMLEKLVEKRKDKALYADSAYKGKEIESCLGFSIENQICEKGYRNKPLTDEQKVSNKKKSSVRVRVEHIFGFMTNSMKGMSIRCIGMERAKFAIGMMNLVYNMSRYRYLVAAHT
ncbi:MAG: IS5 family transposase [bacterium]